jgi:hypothetical protein
LELDSLGLHRSQKIERKRIVKRGKGGKRMRDAGRPELLFPYSPYWHFTLSIAENIQLLVALAI